MIAANFIVSASVLDSAAAATADACARQQGFYLRLDKLDISIYNQSIDASAAEGAAISYAGDRENDTETAEIHALAAWVFARTHAHLLANLRSGGLMSPGTPSRLRF